MSAAAQNPGPKGTSLPVGERLVRAVSWLLAGTGVFWIAQSFWVDGRLHFGNPSAVVALGDRVWVADGAAGLAVLDRASGAELARAPTVGEAAHLPVLGDLVLTAEGPAGVGLYDRSGAGAPRRLAQLDTTDVIKEHLFGVDPTDSWGTAFGNRPLVLVAVVLIIVGLGLLVRRLWRSAPPPDRVRHPGGWSSHSTWRGNRPRHLTHRR